MTRVQALLIALSVAFAVVAGTYAAMQTTHLGTGATTHVSPTAIAVQSRSLDRTAAALHHALKQRPPKLPPVRRPAKAAPRVVYVPGPSPVVTVAPQPVAAPPRRRAAPKPVTRVVTVKRQAPSAAIAILPRPTGTRGAAGPGTTPPPPPTTTVGPAVVAPTTTTTAPTTTSHSSPPASSGGSDDGGGDNGGGVDD